MKNPKISILIPLYNSEEYIAETIDSCLNQTYDNIEIIIVDDGSTDSSLKIARQYEKEHKNIKVEAQQNSGAPVARNRAFELSKGDYIQYIDADDLMEPDKIRLQVEVLKTTDARALAFGRFGIFKKNIKNVIWKDLPVNKNYDDPKQFLVELWASGRAAITHLWLIPRILVEESGGWNERLAKNQDGDFFARIIFNASKIIFVNDSICYYRKDNKNSISKQVSRKALEATLHSFDTYMDLMKDELDEPNVRKSLALVYSKHLFYLYPEHKDLVQNTEEKLKYLGFKKPIIQKGKKHYCLSKVIGVYGVIWYRRLISKLHNTIGL